MVKIKIKKSIQVEGICDICCFSGSHRKFTDFLIKDSVYEFADIWYFKNNISHLIINNIMQGSTHPDRLVDVSNEYFELVEDIK